MMHISLIDHLKYFEEILHYLQTGIMRNFQKNEAFQKEMKFYEISQKKIS